MATLQELYDALKADGAPLPDTYEKFDAYMTAPGTQGCRNRKQVYDALKADGAPLPDTYEEFSRALFVPVGNTASGKAASNSAAARPAAPAAQPASTQTQPPASKPQPTTANGKNGGWQPSAAQRAAFKNRMGDINASWDKMRSDFQTRMEGREKGGRLDASLGTREFNPQTGKHETVYYTRQGERVGSRIGQSQRNDAWRRNWEETTEEGKRSKEKRLEREYERRLGAMWSKVDPTDAPNAAEQTWAAAEEKFKKQRDANADREWDSYNALGGGKALRTVTATMNRHADMVDQLTTFDLDTLMQQAWDKLGAKGQQNLIDYCHQMLRYRYPGADEIELYKQAEQLARQQSNLRLYNLAVEKNMPQDKLEYFMRKVGDMNLLMSIEKGLARSRAGKTGDMEAREEAMGTWDKDHRVLGVTGTVVGFAFDPTTWLSAGVGGAASKATLRGLGRYVAGRGATAAMTKAAVRKVSTTLGGRVVAGVVGGAVNFGTFEAIKEAENQFVHGGEVIAADENDDYRTQIIGYKVGDYSAGAIAKQGGHGMLMGAAIGWLGPLSGNVSDKFVRATASTAGKAAIRTGTFVGSTLAEGTIFSVPEWLSGKRDAYDVWTDNMAMMIGFKVQHGLKSAPRTIEEFGRTADGRKGMESRIREYLDRPSDGGIALTKDEKAELKEYGYDLNEMVRDAGDPTDAALVEARQEALPSKLTEMVTDPRLSESVRAKMYYYATGRRLPMSTIMRGEMLDSGDGGFIVQSIGANGVITSRSFKSRKAADLELERINRQAELNRVDIGEKYRQDATIDEQIMEASRRVAAKNGWNAVDVYKVYEKIVNGRHSKESAKELEDAEKAIYGKILNELGEIDTSNLSEVTDVIRETINKRYGVDIDKALAKEINRRSNDEQKAIDEYQKELYKKRDSFEGSQKLLTSGDEAESEPIDTRFEDVADDNGFMMSAEDIDTWQNQQPIGRAVMKYEDRPVEVLNGRVVMMDDGSMVDKEQSDATIVIRDVATGRVEMCSPDDILSYEDYVAETQTEDAEPIGDNAAPTRKYGAGIINIRNSDGSTTLGYLTGHINENGEYEYVTEGNKPHYASEYDLDNMVAEYIPDQAAEPIVAKDSQGNQLAVGDEIVLSAGRRGVVQEIHPDGRVTVNHDGDIITYNEAYGDITATGLRKVAPEAPPAEQPTAPTEPQGGARVPDGMTADRTIGVAQRDGSIREYTVAKDQAGKQYVVDESGFMWGHDGNGENMKPYRPGESVSEWTDEQIARLSQPAQPSVAVPEQPEIVPTTAEIGENAANIVPNPAESGENAANIVPNPAETVLTEQPAAEPTPLQRVPKDANGEPKFEATDHETAWDALVEYSEGDAVTAKEIADAMVEEKKKALDRARKLKIKGNTPAEMLASKKANAAELDKAQKEFEQWQRIAGVEQRRKDAERSVREAEARQRAAERAAQEAAERAAREEAERIEREELNGVPEWHQDTPENARARGFRRFSGQKWERQEPLQGVVGKEVEVKFSSTDIPRGRIAVIEAGQLQPSHIQGERNPLFFIEEAQPKNRTDDVSKMAAKVMAEGIRPEEITGSATAYTGAPTVNTRGEVIQGNNRSDALRYLWENPLKEQQGKYKQFLIDNAEQFGIDPTAVEAMSKPVLVNMLDVDDAEAIHLGQLTAQDTESGGIERIKAKNVAQKLGERMREFANKIMRSEDEEASFGQLVDRNGTEVLQWMNQTGAITPTQYQSAFDSKGNLTAEAKNDLSKVLYQAVFKGANQQLEELFDKLPAKAQRAILSTAFRDLDSPFSQRMLGEIQASVRAYDELMSDANFANAKKMEEVMRSVQSWTHQTAWDDRMEPVVPADNYSNFALHLAALYKASDYSQKTIATTFNEMYDMIQGTVKPDLFNPEPDTTPRTLAEAIREKLGIDYQPAKNDIDNGRNGSTDVALDHQPSEAGQRGSSEPPASGEPAEGGEEPADGGGRAATDSEAATEQPAEVSETASVDATESVQHAVEAASAEVNVTPTPAQAEAGNYKKGHITVGDFDITIENPAGSVRSGVDANGTKWETTMANTYGYIKGTEGVDGDHIDVFLAGDLDAWNGRKVFVVDQTKADGTFDEHKVMLGFNDKDEAFAAYLANYNKDWAQTHQGLRISEVNIDDFHKWIESSHRKTKPFADYSTVAKTTDNDPTGETISGEGYTIAPKPYTNKQGKTLDIYLVSFDRDFSKEEMSALRAKAKAVKGWYDRESKGWMLRSAEDARAFAEDVMSKSEDEVADEAPLSIKDTTPAPKPTVKRVDINGVADALRKKGSTKLSDHAEPIEQPKPKKRPESGRRNKWISDEDAAEFGNLMDDLRRELGGGDIVEEEGVGYGNKPKVKPMNPEVLRKGTIVTYMMMKGGLRKFSDYCEAMVDELGDAIRPHLKPLYAATKMLEEVMDAGWDEEMDKWEAVKAFDVYNFDKQGAVDLIETAQHVVDEQASAEDTEKIINQLKDQRNEQRRKEADATSADTKAIIDKAEAAASEVEDKLKDAADEETAEALAETIDKNIEAVNKQLALLGYYEADAVDKDYNEAYGYMRNAERKATQDADVDEAQGVSFSEEDESDAVSEPEAEYFFSEEKRQADEPERKKIGNFASRYETQDGHSISYTSENPEGYLDADAPSTVAPTGGKGAGSSPSLGDSRATRSSVQRKNSALLATQHDRLGEGEYSHIERIFRESNAFEFTSGEKVRSAADVAFIFEQLENASVENAFAVLVKGGRPTVVHLSMGTFNATMVNAPVVKEAAARIKPDKIYFVHNHPSGELKCSPQDVQSLRNMEKALGMSVEGVIINLKSGKYGTFGTSDPNEIHDKGAAPEQQRRLRLYAFDRHVFAPDYDPTTPPEVPMDADAVAQYISSHRLGARGKISYLIRANNGGITANIHSQFTEIGYDNIRDIADDIISHITNFGGTSAFIYGDYDYAGGNSNIYGVLRNVVRERSGGSYHVIDAVRVGGNATWSAQDRGLMEPGTEYGAKDGDLRYREVGDERVLDEFASGKTVKAYRTMQVIDGGLYSPMATKVGGKETPEIRLGVAEQSEEHPEIIKGSNVGKDGVEYGVVVINKGLGKGTLEVAYNPYIHASRTALNDQFTSAHVRPNLVTVEVEIPESELASGYRAESAKNAVGEMPWHSGSVSGQLADLGRPRRVILSRYDKPIRIVPYKEVAEIIAKQLAGTDIEIPYNVVQPQVAEELRRLGVRISDEASGSVGAGEDFGRAEYITDEQIAQINARQRAMADESAEGKRRQVEAMSERLNTPVRIIENVEDITDADAAKQAKMRRAKGWYDPKSGEIVVNLSRNRNVGDVAETMLHEVVAHKGLRELVGEDGYSDFLREVYEHAKKDVRERIEAKAADNGWDFEKATDEYLGELSEKGFEDFTEGERSIWQKLKQKVLDTINKLLKGIKLPKWVKLGDNELRYMLWRSHENLRSKGSRGSTPNNPSGEDYVTMARDIAKREELGLNHAIKESEDWLELRKVNERFNEQLQSLTKENSQNVRFSLGVPSGVLRSTGIANKPMLLYGNKVVKKALNHGFTFEELKDLPNAVQAPIAIFKGNHERSHAILTALKIGGNNVLVTLEVGKGNDIDFNIITSTYGKDFNNVLNWIKRGQLLYADKEKALNYLRISAPIAEAQSNQGLDAAKVIKEFENPKSDSNDELIFRDPGETDDIWKDGSLGLEERITNASIRLSNNQRGDLTLRNDAMRAVCDNLQTLLHDMRNRSGRATSFNGADAKVERGVAQSAKAQRLYDRVTAKRVGDLARVLMQNGYLRDMTSGEMQRIVSALKNATGGASRTGVDDIASSVEKIMDIMIDNQVRSGKEALSELMSIRGSRVDSRGVEVQGTLDADGSRMMQAVRRGMTLSEVEIKKKIAEAVNRMGDSDQTIADDAALEYAGMKIALDYVENITGSKNEEKDLRDSLKDAKAEKDAGRMTADAYNQLVEATEDAIRKNKIERAEAYNALVGRLSDSMRQSIENAKAWREAEKQRIQEIQHNANSDMQGMPSDMHRGKDTWKDGAANLVAATAFAPLATFEQMMRGIAGQKAADGEGYLYNRFIRGLNDARAKEISGYRGKQKKLDEKAKEIFSGTKHKVKSWGDVIRLERKLPKMRVTYFDKGANEMKDAELMQGNLLYIYMVDKMSDGRMKLRKMGITEDDVTAIADFLDPRIKALGDWLQEEFLVETRNEYNETHKRMFGTSMAAIDNYFPLKILGDARGIQEDIDAQDTIDGATSTITGAIKKRKVNTLALDILGADAFNVVLDHLAEMEHWNAYAEIGRDMNALLSYGKFRNRVKNMRTIYGAGDQLWKRFKDVSRIAFGTYHKEVNDFDEGFLKVARGVTAAKVAFRLNTALKQALSLPAMIPDMSVSGLIEGLKHPRNPFTWCMENLPVFEERWRSRISGDPRLMKSERGWNDWRNNVVEIAGRWGMTPNAFVDAVICSVVAKTIYDTKLRQYIKDGYTEEDAAARAKQDASIGYNLSQQSSEGAYLAPIQANKNWLSVMWTVFRNSPMSYTRQVFDSVRNLKRHLTPGKHAEQIEYMTKQTLREWQIDPDNATDKERAKAKKAANRRYGRSLRRDALRLLTYGFVLPGLWSLGGYWLYMLLGNDEEEKQQMKDDIYARLSTAPFEGLTGGDVLSNVASGYLNGTWNENTMTKDMPLSADIMQIAKKLFKEDKTADGINDIFNLCIQSGFGFNPATIENAVLGIMDACGNDVQLANEATIEAARILNCPESQVKKLYFDEIGMSGEEASKLSPAEIAERYARMQVKLGRPIMPWLWNDEAAIDKRMNGRYGTLKLAKERFERQGDSEVKEAYAGYKERHDAIDEKMKAAKKLMQTDHEGAEQMKAEVQSDSDFTLYQQFHTLDKQLTKLASMWIKSESGGEAEVIATAVNDYRASMVKVLGAESFAEQQAAMQELQCVMQRFNTDYTPYKPQPKVNR